MTERFRDPKTSEPKHNRMFKLCLPLGMTPFEGAIIANALLRKMYTEWKMIDMPDLFQQINNESGIFITTGLVGERTNPRGRIRSLIKIYQPTMWGNSPKELSEKQRSLVEY